MQDYVVTISVSTGEAQSVRKGLRYGRLDDAGTIQYRVYRVASKAAAVEHAEKIHSQRVSSGWVN